MIIKIAKSSLKIIKYYCITFNFMQLQSKLKIIALLLEILIKDLFKNSWTKTIITLATFTTPKDLKYWCYTMLKTKPNTFILAIFWIHCITM